MPPAKKAKFTPDSQTRMLALHGPEALLKTLYVSQLREALEAEHGQVDRFDFEGDTASLADVLDELRTFSLMSGYKLVVVRSAESFVKTHRQALERYAEQPVDHATLVLVADGWHPGKLDKAMAKCGGVIKCDALKGEQLTGWIVKRAQGEHQCKIDKATAAYLAQRVGSNLAQLDSELGKLAAMAGAQTESSAAITRELIQQLTGPSSDERAFAIQLKLLKAMATDRTTHPTPIELLRDTIDVAREPDVLVSYAVSDLMRKLALLESMRQQRVSDKEIRSKLRLWGEQASLMDRVVNRWPAHRASQLLAKVLRADAAGKSGMGNTRRNLECFVATLTDGTP